MGEIMDDCVFCKIIKGDLPSYKIYENESTLAFLDISNDAFGHTLVIPKKHVVNVLDCDEQILAEVMKTAKLVANHYVKNCGFDAVNILNASGKAAEQSVFHLHFHIIPRKNGDGLNLWPKFDVANPSLEEVWQKLKF